MGFGKIGPMRAFPGVPGTGGNTAVAILATVLRFTVWVLLILAVLWVVREIIRAVHAARRPVHPPHNPALAELEMRYARGEVTRDDYLSRRADLAAITPATAPPPAS